MCARFGIYLETQVGFDYFQVMFHQTVKDQVSLEETLKVVETFANSVMKKL